MGLLERVWEHREEVLYRSLFGDDRGPGIYLIPPSIFGEVFRQTADPRWLHVGVFACPPSTGRAHWVFVTSGLSNPWEIESAPEEPEAVSGLGHELVLSTTIGGTWPIEVLSRLAAFDLLLGAGRYPGRDPLCLGDRIPLGGPIVPGSASVLRNVLLCAPSGVTSDHRLESGWVRLLQVVGVSDTEVAYAREHGHDALISLLAWREALGVTDPGRQATI